MSEILVDRIHSMPPVSIHDINNKVGILDSRFDGMEERADRIDRHLEASDKRVEELRTFMTQVKTIGFIIGIVWPLVVKYLLPK